jgi:membrane protein YqaA with SNARE-associated domain
MTKLRQYFPHILALVFAIAIVAVVPFLPIKWHELKGYGYLGIFVINVIGSATLFFPVPGLAVAFVGGGVNFNPLIVAVVGAAGSTLGEITGWLAGWGGQVVVEKSKRYAQIESWMRRYGDVTVFVMAAIPNPLFDLAGLASGSLRYPLWRFLGAAFLGKLVKYTVVTLLGAASFPGLLHFFNQGILRYFK